MRASHVISLERTHQISPVSRIFDMNSFKSRIRKSVFLFAAALALPAAGWAHDFWLAPEAYAVGSPQIVNVSVMIGHPEDRLSWPVAPHRIVSLRTLGPDGIRDQQAAVLEYKASKNLPIKLEEQGLHILTIETTSSVSILAGEKFNDYVEEEGLTPIKIDRVIKGTTDKPGRETYSRRGKSLIQVGEMSEIDPPYLTRPLGLTLEIVPLQNPARLEAGEIFSSRVYYRGVPISGATIGLIDLDSDDGIFALKKTQANGLVEFDRPKAGSWMLHAVWSDPLEESDTADYDTVFSSLSFNIK